jgi:hypothetical protein
MSVGIKRNHGEHTIQLETEKEDNESPCKARMGRMTSKKEVKRSKGSGGDGREVVIEKNCLSSARRMRKTHDDSERAQGQGSR